MRKGAFTRRWFKEIPGLPGYWINKKGRVWSMKTRRFLRWFHNIKYYWRVNLFVAGRRARAFVHRLVAITFIPNPDPSNKIEVNHKDYNTENPYAGNLEWMTPLENRLHKMARPWADPKNNYDDVPF
jgi:hypothetical protein